MQRSLFAADNDGMRICRVDSDLLLSSGEKRNNGRHTHTHTHTHTHKTFHKKMCTNIIYNMAVVDISCLWGGGFPSVFVCLLVCLSELSLKYLWVRFHDYCQEVIDVGVESDVVVFRVV